MTRAGARAENRFLAQTAVELSITTTSVYETIRIINHNVASAQRSISRFIKLKQYIFIHFYSCLA